MILYSVYVDDWENPNLIFRTYDKGKAYTFRDKYNSENKTDPIHHNECYITEEDITPDVLEDQADQIIQSYENHYRVVILNGKVLYNKVFLPLGEEYASEYSIENSTNTEIYLNEYRNPEEIDWDSEENLERIEKLKAEWL